MFILKTAFRYAFSKSGGRRRSAVMQILGIAAGVLALMVVSAVMNALQSTQLQNLRDIESFDLTVSSEVLSKEDIKALDSSCRVYESAETAVLIVDRNSGMSTSARVRAAEKSLFTDPRFSSGVVFYTDTEQMGLNGAFSFTMIRNLNMSAEDELEITFLRPGKTATIVPYNYSSSLGGIYGSSMSDYSSSTVLMSIDALKEINPGTKVCYAVYTDMSSIKLSSLIKEADPDAQVMTWQEYNRAIYSALTLEKTIMYVFLGFMFLILCVNLKNTTKRLLKAKQSEGAMLMALGCTRKKVNLIFILQALIICLLGEVLGVVLGQLAVSNIQNILKAVDEAVYILTSRRTILTGIPFDASIGFGEILFICLSVLLMVYILIKAGCRKIFRKQIMEVIANVPD